MRFKTDAYREFIDAESFASWILGHDYLATGDGLGCNMYIYKNDSSADSKMKMGPMWDFDMNYWVDGFAPIHNSSFFIFRRLLRNLDFYGVYKDRFEATKDGILDYVLDSIDSLDSTSINGSRIMESKRWNAAYSTVEDNRLFVENWFIDRVEWLDSKI